MLSANIEVTGLNPPNIANKLLIWFDNSYNYEERRQRRIDNVWYNKIGDNFYLRRRFPKYAKKHSVHI